MARFIQLPSRKTINLDAVLWIDHPVQQRVLKIVFYGHSELLIKDEADKQVLLQALNFAREGEESFIEESQPTRSLEDRHVALTPRAALGAFVDLQAA